MLFAGVPRTASDRWIFGCADCPRPRSCKDKTKQWEERQKTRNDEVVAISETIKMLNADDARDLFKSTLPSPETTPPPSSRRVVRGTALWA